MDLDDLVDCVSQNIHKANRSNVYRTIRAFQGNFLLRKTAFASFGISQVPQEQKI